MEWGAFKAGRYALVGCIAWFGIALGCEGSEDIDLEVGTTEQMLETAFDPALCGDSSGLEPEAAWPEFGACSTGRRSSPHVATRSAFVNWTANLGAPIRSSPAVGADGSIYVGNNAGGMFAYAPDGTRRWRVQLLGPVRSSPAIGSDGTVYVGADVGGLSALNPADGSQRWNFFSAFPVRSSPAIGGGSKVYFAGSGQFIPGNFLYALDTQTGAQRFRVTLNAPASSAPAIGPDGTVYVATDGFLLIPKTLYAIDPETGSVRWTATVGGLSTSGPAVAPDGTIYVPSGQRALRAFRLDGTLRWQYQHTCGIFEDCSATATPAIAPDGTVYFATHNGKLAAISPEGQQRWEQSLGGRIESSPAVDADGWVYIGTNQNALQMRDATFGSERFRVTTGGAVRSSPAISSFGTVYVGSENGMLYSVGERYTAFARGSERIPIGECSNNRLPAGTTTEVCLVRSASDVGRRDFYVNGRLTTPQGMCVPVTISRYVEVRVFEYSPQGALVASNAVFLTTSDNPKHCPIHDHVILGGPGDDVLTGTSESEYISSGPGVDYIVPRGGDDIVVGGDDPDTFDLTGPEINELGALSILDPDVDVDRVLANAPASSVPAALFSPAAACSSTMCIDVPRNFERVYNELSDRDTFAEPSFRAIRQIHDIGGGYIAVGHRRARGANQSEPLIVKLTPSGEIEWVRTSADYPELLEHDYLDVQPLYDKSSKRVGYVMAGTGFVGPSGSQGFVQVVDLQGEQLALNVFIGRFADEAGLPQGGVARNEMFALATAGEHIVAVGATEGTGKLRFPDGTWREQPGKKGYIVVLRNEINNGRLRDVAAEAIAVESSGSGALTMLLTVAFLTSENGRPRIAVGGSALAGSSGPVEGFLAVAELQQGSLRPQAVSTRRLSESGGRTDVHNVADVPGIGVIVAGLTGAFKTGELANAAYLKLTGYDLQDVWGADPEAGPFFAPTTGYALLGGYTSSSILSVSATDDGGFFAVGGATHIWDDALIDTPIEPEIVGLVHAAHGLIVRTDGDGLSRRYRSFGHENNDPDGTHVFNVSLSSGQQTTDLGFVAAGLVCPGVENAPGPRRCTPEPYVVKVEPDLSGADAVCSCDNGRVDCGESVNGFLDATQLLPGDCAGPCAACAIDCGDFMLQSTEAGRDCGGVCADPYYSRNGTPQECACGSASDCDDGSVCTVDSCDPSVGCANDPAPLDGTACSGGVCQNGVCTAQCTASGCNDGNECTADSCNPASGCVHDGGSRDGAICENNTGTCSGGSCIVRCVAGCNDNNACTIDSCNPALGCSHLPVTDGTECGARVCIGGSCVTPTFNANVNPILQHYCIGCHKTPPCSAGRCFVDDYAAATASTSSSACTTRSADTVAECIAARAFDGSMPPFGADVTPLEVNILEAWVTGGAPQ